MYLKKSSYEHFMFHTVMQTMKEESANEKTLTLKRSVMSIITLNGLRVLKYGIKAGNRVFSMNVDRCMFLSLRAAHKSYTQDIDMEKKMKC